MKVKCIKGYYDTKFNKSVAIGETFDVAEDRAKQLTKAGVCEVTTTTTEKVATKKPRAKKEA